MDEFIEGVHVLRTKIRPRKQGSLNRVLNYYSFVAKGKKRVKKLKADFDAILVFQLSPIMMVEPALAFAKKYGIPILCYVIDLWPESLLAGGIRRDSKIYQLFRSVSRRIYSSVDALAVSSPAFSDYLTDLLNRKVNATYLPQFAEDIFSEPFLKEDGIDSRSFPKDCLNVMFAGNVGAAQSVGTLIEAASLLKHERIVFHIVGSGTELDSCKVAVDRLGLHNVVFYGRHPLNEMPAYYAQADAMVATFADDPILGYTLPRKIQSYMAAGKPVIGTVTGEARRVLEEAGCGFCCDAENAAALADCCRKMAALSDEERNILGLRAKTYCEKHYSRDRFFETLESELDTLRGTRHRGSKR